MEGGNPRSSDGAFVSITIIRCGGGDGGWMAPPPLKDAGNAIREMRGKCLPKEEEESWREGDGGGRKDEKLKITNFEKKIQTRIEE